MSDGSTAKVLHGAKATEQFIDEQCFICEWSNHPDDPTASIARARVEPGVQTRWHRLRGVSERYVVISGNGLVEVEGLEPETVGYGDVVFIPADHAQRIRNTGADDLVFLAICTPRFSPETYESLETPTD